MRLYAADLSLAERATVRVWLGRVELTDDVVAADDVEGWVAVIDRAGWRRRHLRGLAPLVRHYGAVRIVRGDAPAAGADGRAAA